MGRRREREGKGGKADVPGLSKPKGRSGLWPWWGRLLERSLQWPGDEVFGRGQVEFGILRTHEKLETAGLWNSEEKIGNILIVCQSSTPLAMVFVSLVPL